MQTIPDHPIAGACSISQEVVDMIIDKLAGHLPSLQACALVCRRWLRRSHYQLFRVVEFTDVNSTIHRWSMVFPAGGATG